MNHAIEELITELEKKQARLISDERFLVELYTMPYWKFIWFGRGLILNHLKRILSAPDIWGQKGT